MSVLAEGFSVIVRRSLRRLLINPEASSIASTSELAIRLMNVRSARCRRTLKNVLGNGGAMK